MHQHLDALLARLANDAAAAVATRSYLQETLLVLQRRKLVIVATIITLTALAAVYVFTATPLYTTKLQILFQSKVGPIFDYQAAALGAPQDEAAIISETEVIKSRSVAERVIHKLKLAENPEFNPKLRPKGGLVTFLKKQLPQSWVAEPDEQAGPSSMTDDQRRQFAPPPQAASVARVGEDQRKQDVAGPSSMTDDQRRQFAPPPQAASVARDGIFEGQYEWKRIVDTFLEKIKVAQVPRSRSVEISFTANQPEVAAKALNMIAEMYLLSRLEDRFENAKRAADWLAERTEALKSRVQRSEKEVEDYKRSHNLFESSRETLVSQRISELNGKLTDARIERRTAEANLATVHRLLSARDAMETATQVLQSELIRRFRQDEMELERREAEMREALGPQHPAMIQIRAERQRLAVKLVDEINKIARSLENEVQVARDRELALQQDLQSVKDEMARANEAAVGLHTLEREAEANKLLLDKFLTSFTETSAQEDIKSQVPDARIISQAPIEEHPSFPPKALLLAFAFVGSTVTGVLLAFAVERLDAGLHSAEEIEAETGLPVIANVPLVKATSTDKGDLASYSIRNPSSAYADAIRSVYTHLLLTFKGSAPKIILFTSPEANGGKSTIALSFVRQQAQAGRRVILVDADFRRSRVGLRVGVPLAPGLSELIAGMASKAQVIQCDPESPAHLLVAGKQPVVNFAIGDFGRLGAFFTDLRTEYDLIIIDSPPVLALADTRILVAMADVTLMIVRWGHTPRRALRFAMHQIAGVGGDVNRIILSMVNVKRQKNYGFGDSGYYNGKLAKYHYPG